MTPLAAPIRALLFGPGLAAAGSRVAVTVDPLQLSLSLPDGQRLTQPLSATSLRRAGFNESHWELSWSRGEQRWALLIDDAVAIAKLLAQPPVGLRTAITSLRQAQRQSKLRRSLGASALMLWLGLPLLALLALVIAARPLAAWASGLIPVTAEQRLGDWVFKSQVARLNLLEGTVANQAVEQIGSRLTAGSLYTYRWQVAREPSLNAFAIAGGIVVVHTGLILAADSAEELAGVLAHEIEHVELRHSLKSMMSEAGLRVTLAVLLGDFGMAGEAAGQLSSLHFSRASESEADRRGLERLVRAGIDPRGMPRLFTKLDDHPGPTPPAWLSSRPATAARIEALNLAIKERRLPPPPPMNLDWKAVHASINPSSGQ